MQTIGFDEAFETILKHNRPTAKVVRVLARSPQSASYRRVAGNLQRAAEHGVAVRVVFVSMNAREAEEVFSAFASAFGIDDAMLSLRVCMFRDSDDASEQLMLGDSAIWMGHEDSDEQDALTLEVMDEETVQLGALTFSQMWDMSAPLPKKLALKFAAKRGAPRANARSR